MCNHSQVWVIQLVVVSFKIIVTNCDEQAVTKTPLVSVCVTKLHGDELADFRRNYMHLQHHCSCDSWNAIEQ